jgi:hypothetical protein
MSIDRRPAKNEYADYYHAYVSRVPEGDVLEFMTRQCRETVALLSDVDEETARSTYASGKWSLAEVVGHVLDAEWVFTYRALTFSRKDRTELPGMDQDIWVPNSNHNQRPLSDILEEFRNLRAANVALFGSFTEDQLDIVGTANQVHLSVRSIPFIIAGHETHHVGVLKERYLASV